MCNGANLAYRKTAFYEVKGFEGNERVSSGDDEFLMNKFNKKSVRYLKSKDSLVTSAHLPLVTSFINQRLRWAGKWSVNTSLFTKLVAVIVFGFHLSFIVAMFTPSKLAVTILFLKALLEALLLIPAASFFRVKWRWIPFIALQLLYPVYVISVGLLSQVVLPKWKGRVVETKV
jgi:cellulose synthase/poly-beta-1,6-N-acetylglucosamine synthase-like glycosyltransferase